MFRMFSRSSSHFRAAKSSAHPLRRSDDARRTGVLVERLQMTNTFPPRLSLLKHYVGVLNSAFLRKSPVTTRVEAGLGTPQGSALKEGRRSLAG